MSTEVLDQREKNAFILVDGKRYIARLYYVGSKEKNILACLWRDTKDAGCWHFDYRFRYYVDDRLDDDSKDRRSHYTCVGPDGGSREEAIELARKFHVDGGQLLAAPEQRSDRRWAARGGHRELRRQRSKRHHEPAALEPGHLRRTGAVVNRSRWTHALCQRCWTEARPEETPVRADMAAPYNEQCCRCGAATTDRIYTRAEPGTFDCCNHLAVHPADADGIFKIEWSSGPCHGCRSAKPVRAAVFEEMQLTIILGCCASESCWTRTREFTLAVRSAHTRRATS